jgi:hypothetical protein
VLLTLLPVLPKVRRWLRATWREHDTIAKPVSAFGFPRLGSYYRRDLLDTARAAIVERVPTPPVSEWGFDGVFDFGATAGITFGDMFFIVREQAGNESIFFHELVHVVQYRTLGTGRFLALYGLLRTKHDYAQHPLERPAFELQDRFDAGDGLFDPEPIAARHASTVAAEFRRGGVTNRLILIAARCSL